MAPHLLEAEPYEEHKTPFAQAFSEKRHVASDMDATAISGLPSPTMPDYNIERCSAEQARSLNPFLARVRLDRSPRLPGPSVFYVDGREFNRVPSPLGPHPIVELFDTCPPGHSLTMRQRLAEIIRNDSPSGILVLRYGFSNLSGTEQYPTIQLALNPKAASEERAVELAREAADYIFQFPTLRDLSIEITETAFTFYCSENDNEKYRKWGYYLEDAYRPVPTTGTSIGPSQGSKRTGTLGGYVRVRFKRKPGLESPSTRPASYEVVAALTCHHVVSGKPMQIIAHPENDCISVPSAGDHESFQKILLEPDGQVKNSYHNTPDFSFLKIKRKAGFLSKGEEKVLNLYEKMEKLEKQRGELCKAFDPSQDDGDIPKMEDFGPILDWALVAVDPFRVGFDMDCIPGVLTRDQATKLRLSYAPSDGLHIRPHNGIDHIDDIDELKARFGAPDDPKRSVFMIGRTSGMKLGAISEVDASVEMRIEIDGVEEPIRVVGKTTVIVTPPGAIKSDGMWAFGSKGDSGSLVYTYQGKALAVYHGGVALFDIDGRNPEPDNARNDGIHFATPIKDTFKDIIKVLVSDPANAEYDIDAVELI
ncbi:uncharacterized protein E0L32_000859 [Thyridium curvatum]|uniref:Uncharacterized protein n=1 Tax=Thyridium curvatum TaxID=1093900 RepID=A0A507ARR5_9PEZI|nr:uncharacterized protein E0L32_000859 [Thyridium curvatum]TPX12682.1 hypothetical protein E0L32_000859 [Thyridium curvatum]